MYTLDILQLCQSYFSKGRKNKTPFQFSTVGLLFLWAKVFGLLCPEKSAWPMVETQLKLLNEKG